MRFVNHVSMNWFIFRLGELMDTLPEIPSNVTIDDVELMDDVMASVVISMDYNYLSDKEYTIQINSKDNISTEVHGDKYGIINLLYLLVSEGGYHKIVLFANHYQP